jgi:hypothetical protein
MEHSADENININWVTRDRIERDGCHHQCELPAAPSGLLSKITNTIWPVLEARCPCDALFGGWLGGCIVRGAIDRGKQACLASLGPCRWTGMIYWECVGGICGSAF